MKSFKEIEESIKDKYDDKLWRHTSHAIETARGLAERHGVDIEKTAIAALLHDYGKTYKDIGHVAKNLGLTPNAIEQDEPLLLHAAVSAGLARRDLAVDDEEILSAIEKHTFGALSMSALDKVLYVSDMVEHTRDYPERHGLLELAQHDLDEGYCACLAHKVKYILKKKQKLHPNTVEVWNSCLNKTMKRSTY